MWPGNSALCRADTGMRASPNVVVYVHERDLINKLKPKNLLLQFVLGPVK